MTRAFTNPVKPPGPTDQSQLTLLLGLGLQTNGAEPLPLWTGPRVSAPISERARPPAAQHAHVTFPSCSARYRCSARVALLALARALSRPICIPRSRSSQPEVKRTQKTVSAILFAKESLLSFKINPHSLVVQK